MGPMRISKNDDNPKSIENKIFDVYSRLFDGYIGHKLDDNLHTLDFDRADASICSYLQFNVPSGINPLPYHACYMANCRSPPRELSCNDLEYILGGKHDRKITRTKY
jgi:hypothetical protein